MKDYIMRAYIDGHVVVRYSEAPHERYWPQISRIISEKYGTNEIVNHDVVNAVLRDAFSLVADKFKSLVYEETSFTFFRYILFLHEESLKLNSKIQDGITELHTVSRNEFAMYRRILKNILEQGCEINLAWGEFPTPTEIYRMDAKLQDLLYLGRWLYDLADSIALHEMIGSFHTIWFDEGELAFDIQRHYGELYKALFPQLEQDYENATFDERGVHKLRAAIESCFGIDYDYALGQIELIKGHFSADGSQPIQPDVLPQNLATEFRISIGQASQFYDGLTLSRANKMSLEDLVCKPYNLNRYMFRPILIYNIGGADWALIGKEKLIESMVVLGTNVVHWNALPQEWRQNRCMEQFMSRMSNEHDKILEDVIESKIKVEGLLYVRNIKSFKRPGANNININNAVAGEMDFIIVNERLKKIFAADSKYNRARFEAVGYRADNSKFINDYEAKIRKKADWVANNLEVVTGHFRIIYNRPHLDFTGYEVEPVFFINTPTFYMFNGDYKAITLNRVSEYLSGRFRFQNFTFKNIDPEADNQYDIIGHPYFR
ncbi:hypothetical protein [Parachryseolinea silvisoli]|uniref:hypothetical protein n=1 Tax=Parachryseolinea silvisoli TaxID=2873601 RepID=UPI002265B376|nr:hypothetical protein [Parachryseolinea silvisoli]MCD9015212.1 hypothetical protein [Parachryseolinea silvisoli]